LIQMSSLQNWKNSWVELFKKPLRGHHFIYLNISQNGY
jgi:hypothetical protein